MDSNGCPFWLASETWNSLGYSLFCERRKKWLVVPRKFQKKKLWPLMKRHFFIHLIWKILKQLSPSGSVKSGGYIPRRFASQYISTTIHLPFPNLDLLKLSAQGELFTGRASGYRAFINSSRFSIAFTANGKRQAAISRLPKTREIYLVSVCILPVSHSYGASTKNR